MSYHDFHFKLESISSSEEALRLVSETSYWETFVNRVAKDIRQFWVVEPIYVETKLPRRIRIEARLKSGPVSLIFKIDDLDDYMKCRDKAYKDIFLKRLMAKSPDIWSVLVFCSHKFVSWGLEDPKEQWKKTGRNKRYKPNVMMFSHFWLEKMMEDISVKVGETAVEMVNDVIRKARHASKNPQSALNEQEARIKGAKNSVIKYAAVLGGYGVGIDEVISLVKNNYVKGIISQ